jgi:hypothetical protein
MALAASSTIHGRIDAFNLDFRRSFCNELDDAQVTLAKLVLRLKSATSFDVC